MNPDCKKKVELINIFILINLHDLNFSIIIIELLNMRKKYEIIYMPIFS
jgi:hypothetical protein